MGGRAQTGKWTIGARFNSAALAERIRRVHALRNRVTVFAGDGISHVEDLNGSGIEDEVVLFVDPPYLREGNRLYARGMNDSAHQRFADALNATTARWMLTYDDEPLVTDLLYPERRVLAYDIRNTANRARIAREFAVFLDSLDVGDPAGLVRGSDA
ncbi:hypothetical protein [Rathayibacter rathayi]|uniref:hypothetical protein n=1 Tax=Rathayibacter rathayi TaxID=33887 RepID=UPI00215706BF|nr:hypothetical protein [Rathayibacter rathayi]